MLSKNTWPKEIPKYFSYIPLKLFLDILFIKVHFTNQDAVTQTLRPFFASVFCVLAL